jgi:hypothetical protein
MTEETLSGSMKVTVSMITEILCLCVHRPALAEFARDKLTQIVIETQPTRRAQDAIDEHLRRKAGQSGGRPPIFPATTVLRMWAQQIAKTREIPFHRKDMRRKEMIMGWLDSHWDDVESDFLMLLDSDEGNSKA